jgi:serine/threonine-protein kinase RsbW
VDRANESGPAEAMTEAHAAEADDIGRPSLAASTDADTVSLHLPAQSRFIRIARLAGAGLANELGFGVDRLDDVRLAIGEACGLAVHSGAASMIARYELGATSIAVAVEAPIDGDGGRLDPDYLGLVEQVLSVACSSHSIENDGRHMTIRLTFTDGS